MAKKVKIKKRGFGIDEVPLSTRLERLKNEKKPTLEETSDDIELENSSKINNIKRKYRDKARNTDLAKSFSPSPPSSIVPFSTPSSEGIKNNREFNELNTVDEEALAKARSIPIDRYRFNKLPKGIRESVIIFLENENYLSMRPDMALTDAIIREELGELEDFDESTVGAIVELVADLKTAAEDYSEEGTDELRDIALAVAHAVDNYKKRQVVVSRVISHQEHKRKLAETETKRLSAAMRQWTAEQAFTFVNRVMEIITNHVSDPHVVNAIASDIEGEINVPLDDTRVIDDLKETTAKPRSGYNSTYLHNDIISSEVIEEVEPGVEDGDIIIAKGVWLK